MRCFEAIGCGALLVSDAGRYPDGMKPDETMETYGSADQALELISKCLNSWPSSAEVAERGGPKFHKFIVSPCNGRSLSISSHRFSCAKAWPIRTIWLPTLSAGQIVNANERTALSDEIDA